MTDRGTENHAPRYVEGVWCEWCEDHVAVSEYNKNHGSEVCVNDNDE